MSLIKRLSHSYDALMLSALLLGVFGFSPSLRAEMVSIPLSQEQDGGDAGRACIYVWRVLHNIAWSTLANYAQRKSPSIMIPVFPIRIFDGKASDWRRDMLLYRN
nr:hypothetical protein LA636_0845 [Erwinia amylovora LA636]